jgi:hypothetical protein
VRDPAGEGSGQGGCLRLSIVVKVREVKNLVQQVVVSECRCGGVAWRTVRRGLEFDGKKERVVGLRELRLGTVRARKVKFKERNLLAGSRC